MNLEELEKLNDLKEKGIISQKEFDAKKKEIFNADANAKSVANRSIINSFVNAFKNYFKFGGRASRYDYWSFVLINTVISIVLTILSPVGALFSIISGLYTLAAFVPSISVTFRRLHDINKSGWWLGGLYIGSFVFGLMAGMMGMAAQPSGGVSIFAGLLVIAILIYSIMLLVWLCLKGDAKSNKYGAPVL